MAFLRFTTLVLVVLFLMHVFRAFISVSAHQDGDRTLVVQSEQARNAHLPLKQGLGGRKMGVVEKVLENEIGKASGVKRVEGLSAADTELANLLNKDYTNKSKPRRKPPIHNNQPQH